MLGWGKDDEVTEDRCMNHARSGELNAELGQQGPNANKA